MKKQLQYQQTLKHMFDVAKNQSTIVKSIPVDPIPTEPEVIPESVKLVNESHSDQVIDIMNEVTGSDNKSSKK